MKKTKKKVEESPEATNKTFYSISLKLGNDLYEGSGETLDKAFANLPKPVKILTKTILKVTHGPRGFEKVLMPYYARRMFFPLTRRYLLQQFEHLLK